MLFHDMKNNNFLNVNRFGKRIRYFSSLFKRRYSSISLDASSEPIDVIIPMIPKDLDVLPLCLKGLRENVANKIEKIYIVSPYDDGLINYCKEEGIVYVNENDVLGYSAKDVNFVTEKGENRSGWMFQQFLKLAGNVGTCQRYITIDSDHILLNRHVFLTKDDKYVFYRSPEFHIQYHLINKKLLGGFHLPLLSYVSHKMIFDKKELESLKRLVETRLGKRWDLAILDNLDKEAGAPFSEFEFYAGYINKKRKISYMWNQKALKRDEMSDYQKLKERYSEYLSVTFPDYLNNK